MPGVAATALTLALSQREGGRWTARVALVLLATALCLNVLELLDIGFPGVPSALTPLAGAAIGAAVAAAISRLPERWLFRPVVAVVSLVAVAGALAAAAPGIPERHARVFDAHLVRWFARPADDGRPIHMAPVLVGVLAGDDLGRRIEAIPRRESCDEIRRAPGGVGS